MKVVDANPADSRPAPLANVYFLAGMGAVVVLGATLIQSAGQWALVPVLIGAAGLVFRWRSAPMLMLGFITIGQLWPSWVSSIYGYRRQVPLLNEFGMCASILAYIVCQYRLIALTSGAFPRDPRRPHQAPVLRPGDGQPFRELTTTMLTLGGAVVAAFFLWTFTDIVPPSWNVLKAHWRLGVLAWLALGGLAATAGIMAYLGWRRISRDEAAMFLQDALWQETRREQRRINRWRAWAIRR